MIVLYGIRFYETKLALKTPGFKSASFEAAAGEMVEFFFHREEREDLIFRRGKLKHEKYIGYVIHAKFSDVMPEKLLRFNNLMFFFNSKYFFAEDEEIVTKRLLDIYLSVLSAELQK